MANATDDYTRFRTIDPNNPPYEIDDKIGRKDPTYITLVQKTTSDYDPTAVVSGGITTVSGAEYTILRTNYR